MYILQGFFQHVHRECRRPDRDIARPLAHGIRTHHSRSGIPLRRCHECACRESAARIEKVGAFVGEVSRRFPCTQDTRQVCLNVPRTRLYLGKVREYGEHIRIIRPRFLIDGKHPRGVADAEHLLAREPPVHIAC